MLAIKTFHRIGECVVNPRPVWFFLWGLVESQVYELKNITHSDTEKEVLCVIVIVTRKDCRQLRIIIIVVDRVTACQRDGEVIWMELSFTHKREFILNKAVSFFFFFEKSRILRPVKKKAPFLKHWILKKQTRHPEPRKGILFYGPPGCVYSSIRLEHKVWIVFFSFFFLLIRTKSCCNNSINFSCHVLDGN